MFPDVASDKPVVVPTDPMINAPELARKMPPVVLMAATVIPLVAVLTGANGVPMPDDAVISRVAAVTAPED